jgi:hypothetical protein
MVVIDRAAGEQIRIGPYTLRVLEVHPDGVVVALLGPDEDPAAPDGPARGDEEAVPVGSSDSVSAPAP